MRPTTIIKIFIGLLGAAVLTTLMVMNKQESGESSTELLAVIPAAEPLKNEPKAKYRVFHLDLKGAPPKMSYVLQILGLLKRAGVNAILLEYEDMFPWSENLRNLSAWNAYNVTEIEELLVKAEDLEIEVIPLVQTFGHLEFVLKLSEFRNLRELDSFPQEVCPAKSQSYKLIKEMIRQVMAVHRKSRFIHIGCDEVYHLAACPICSRKNPRTVFTAHVKKIASHIRSRYPGVTPIIWDDMMRKWPPAEIEKSELGDYVEPMVWVYIEDIQRLVPHFIWYMYKKTFRNIWGASAFKGAFGEQETIPHLSRHMENNMAWQRVMYPPYPQQAVMQSEDFQGIVFTGWSRYDHFAVLSELLPVSLPSLVLSLCVGASYKTGADDEDIEERALKNMLEVLNCPDTTVRISEIRKDRFPWFFGQCKYPGNEMYQLVREYVAIKMRMDSILSEKSSSGWVTKYNLQHHYSSPYRILQLFQEEGFAGQKLLSDVQRLRSSIKAGFSKYYDNATIEEWIEQKISPIESELIKMASSFQDQLEVKNWPRRLNKPL